MNGETTIEGLLQKAYNSLKDAEVDAALRFLQEALKADYEHREVIFALKCLTWWIDRLKRLEDFHSPYERGGFILTQWKIFYAFQERIGGGFFDSCQYAVKHYVFSLALSSFGETLGETQQDPEVMLQIGRCHKGVGNYEEAVKYLEQAARAKREDSGVLAELADTKALLGESRAAKVLFREAFFLNPQGIDLQSMESEMILRLKEKTAELGHEGRELAEWIPVYGCLWGVFSIKRELKPVELGGLKQSILTLENELRSGSDKGFLKPGLLNRYFRLIDHYENVRDNSEAVEETLLKIKFIDPAIYEQYRN
jgi:tetratricopeptide (TPR) repeat protein